MSAVLLDATHLALRQIGPWLTSLVPAASCERRGAIELGVHELATNCVDHAQPASGTLSLDATVNDRSLTVYLRDDGAAFDVDAVTPPDPDMPQVRGYGLMILEQLADEITYDRCNGENHWRVVFSLCPE